MSKPIRAGNTPIAIAVEAGQSYWWCSCGKSNRQPFCDGSHKESSFNPLEFKATKTETLYFCSCKATKNAPFCDGSHN